MPPVQLRPGINIYLTTTDPCLPIIVWKCNDAYCSCSSQLVPSTPTGKYFLFFSVPSCVALPKKCSENRVLVVLLHIGGKDPTVGDSGIRVMGDGGLEMWGLGIGKDYVIQRNFNWVSWALRVTPS